MKTALKIALCVFIFAIIAQTTGYQTSDPDSQFYVYLTRQMAMRPPSEWMAPYWLGEQGIRADDIVRDHLAGHVATGLGFWHLGVHPSTSLYVASFLWIASSVLLLHYLLRRYLCSTQALMGILLALILPISFLYRVRANHEQSLMLMCVLTTFVAVSLKRTSIQALLIGIVTVAVFLVKGFVFPVIPFLFSIALCFSGKCTLRQWFAGSFAAGLTSLTFVGLTAWLYELQFQATTGMPFFETYVKVQLLERSVNLSLGEYPYIFRRLYALGYYLIQTIWYGIPVTIISLLWLNQWRKTSSRQLKPVRSWRVKLRGIFVEDRPIISSTSPLFVATRDHIQGSLVFLGMGAGYVILLSLSDRVSGRYVFPAFYFIPLGLYLAIAPWFESYLKTVAKPIPRLLAIMTKSKQRAESWLLFVLLALTLLHILTTNKRSLMQFPDTLPFVPIRPEFLQGNTGQTESFRDIFHPFA